MVDAGSIEASSSVIVLTELVTGPKRSGDAAMEQRYRDLLLNSRNFTLVPPGVAIADRAGDLRARYGFRSLDALVVATALADGCQALLTNDRQLRRATELRILLVDDLSL
jgi:predicted nucleic acid-binding protein